MGRLSLPAVLLAATLAGGAFIASPQPVAAQEAEQAEDAYTDLFEAMISATDREAEVENALEATRTQFRSDPDFAMLEAMSPGCFEDVITAMRPSMDSVITRVETNLRREYVKLFREEFTVEEARELARIWRNPVFQRMMMSASRNFVPNAIMSDLESKAQIESEDLQRDVQSAATAAVSEMSLEDLTTIAQLAQNSPAWQKFAQVQPTILEIRLKVENAPLTPSEELEMTRAIEAVVKEHFPE